MCFLSISMRPGVSWGNKTDRRTSDQCHCLSICKSRVSYNAAQIFKQGCITEAYIFFLLNFDLKHRIVGTHIRNNPLHCSQLLSELLVFELIL